MTSEMGDQVIDTFYTRVHTLHRKNGKQGKWLHLMQKDGRIQVGFRKGPGDWSTYLMDIFTTLVEIRWRVMFLVFSLSYILSWMFFGLCYWLIAYIDGDTGNSDESLCVANVQGFTAAFLFSMETQATIGYGFRAMTENCIGAIIVLTIQNVLSCFLDTIVIGIVVAKMASARKRGQTVGFSRCAVVNLRNGVLCLSWRLGDFRGNHILEGSARAQLVHHVSKPQGSVEMVYHDLDIEDQNIVLATPTTIIHKLQPGSPLYSLSPEDLLQENFELVMSFTYTGDSTGLLHQTRTSYSPADIRWGQRFQDLIKVSKKHYKVDYSLFNETTWVPVPMTSAEVYDERRRHTQSSSHLSPTKRNTDSYKITIDNSHDVILQTSL